jgi:rubredoxin
MIDFVHETAIDYAEVYRRGGHNLGDEDFALFKCPACGQIYLIDYEVFMIYIDGDDLSHRMDANLGELNCVKCGYHFLANEPIVGPKADLKFGVTWSELKSSRWAWIAQPHAP